MVAEWPDLWRQSIVTGMATLGGFGLSIVIGIPMAMSIAWYNYGEHAPFYYGVDKGLYQAEGIDLEIQEGRDRKSVV